MPRSRITRGKLKAEIISNALVASARNLRVGDLPVKKIKAQEWQNQGWHFYDTVEVFHYAVTWVGNMLSKAKLIVLENGEPTQNQAALDALESFFGGASNHSEFLRQCGLHMTVAGEGYIIGRPTDGEEDDWEVAASVSVKAGPEGYKVDGEALDEKITFIMRMWRPHPVNSNRSDSPVRPLLPILSIIDEITMYTAAQLESRLASAGLLLLPKSATFPTPTAAEGESASQDAGVNGFIRELAEISALSKTNRGDPSSVVPIVIQMDGEDIEHVKHVTFWSELDEATSEREAAAIRRLGLGLDMPSEQITGTGDVNHWGAWQIDDAAIKIHAEPLLELITSAITEGYLRPVLGDSMTDEEAAKFSIGVDTSEMRLRPDRSKEATEMWDRGELSGVAMLRENGFDPADKMDDTERRSWLLRRLAQGSPSPELVQAAADALGLNIEVPDNYEADGERPLPRSLEGHPTKDIPNPDESESESKMLLATSEALVFRVLERCGNRMLTVKPAIEGLPRDVEKMDLYLYSQLSKTQLDHVLSDAWSSIGRYSLNGVDPGTMETHLDNYVRMLITSRMPYDRSVLSRYVSRIMETG